MSQKISVIACLDVLDGRVVKGVHFEGLRDAGDPAELARTYSEAGADEVVFLDVSASNEGRATTTDVVAETASTIEAPLVIGGGIRSLADAEKLLLLGASRVSVSTAAILDPDLINQISEKFGSEALVVSLDIRRRERDGDAEPFFEVTSHGGTRGTGLDALAWARQVEERGAGSIMVNSIDTDGVQSGFDLEMLSALREAVDLNLIASGGAGSVEDFVAAAKAGANSVLAASVFHFGIVTVDGVKTALEEAGFTVERVDSDPS